MNDCSTARYRRSSSGLRLYDRPRKMHDRCRGNALRVVRMVLVTRNPTSAPPLGVVTALSLTPLQTVAFSKSESVLAKLRASASRLNGLDGTDGDPSKTRLHGLEMT